MSSVWALGLVLIMAGTTGASAQGTLVPSTTSQPKTQTAGAKPTATDLVRPSTTPSPASPSKSITKPATQAARPATDGYVSSWLAEVMKLAQAGVDDSVILPFVDSAGTFNLGADQIIELRDLGVGTAVITAMIDHDFDLLSGWRQMPAAAVAASPPKFTFPVSTVMSGTPLPSPVRTTQGTDPSGSLPSGGEREDPAKFALASASTVIASVSGISGGGSIVVPDLPRLEDEWSPVIRQREAPPVRRGFSPVRAPYPVKLTDPIYIFRGAEPAPNIVVINQLR